MYIYILYILHTLYPKDPEGPYYQYCVQVVAAGAIVRPVQLEPQITSLDKCYTNSIMLDTPSYQISGVGVAGSHSIGGYAQSTY